MEEQEKDESIDGRGNDQRNQFQGMEMVVLGKAKVEEEGITKMHRQIKRQEEKIVRCTGSYRRSRSRWRGSHEGGLLAGTGGFGAGRGAAHQCR